MSRRPARTQPILPGFDFDPSAGDQTAPAPDHEFVEPLKPTPDPIPEVVRGPPGEKAKARDILAAIRTLQTVEKEGRLPTPDEREALARFCGFGLVALSIFPNPATGAYKDGWQEIGEELKALLTPDEYASVKRTTFNAFYTSPVVVSAMHAALTRLGVPHDALVLEPGCGVGGFLRPGKRYIGVELDGISGRIAKALHPDADIRVEDFQKTRLPVIDAVIGNVPFADLKLDHHGQTFSLHDYFFAKSVDALAPGGVLALVTSHYTLDKQNAAIREYLADRADFLGAIRLPSDAFKREGTAVVTDIVFLRKRAPGEPAHHVAEWLETGKLNVEDAFVSVNRYFLTHPEMVLGRWSRKDTLYGGEGFSVVGQGDLAEQLRLSVGRLPRFEPNKAAAQTTKPPPFVPPPPDKHISEGSLFVGEDRVIRQVVGGAAEPVTYCGVLLRADGTPNARKIASLIGLRDHARRVLQSQNDGWPEANRQSARRELNHAYDRFVAAYGPINKTTFTETKDGTTVRRMPNLVKFRDDPDAMLVMALEEYDEETGVATKAPILRKDVVGKTPPVTAVATAQDGLLVSLDHKGLVDLPYISKLYGKPEAAVLAELGDLIFRDPETGRWETADAYLSGNVRAKLVAAEKAGVNVEALKAVQPEDVLPGDIDANLGAPWIPASDVQAFAADLFHVPQPSVTIGHLAKDAVWSVQGDYSAERAVAVTADYGTQRASGLWLLELGLNMKSPVIYDPDPNDPDKRVVNQEATLAAKEKQRAIKEQFKSWVFADPDRTERLVRVYNDAFNNLRPRVFDGSHLDFPGMSQALIPRQHQRDAIWRGMCGGNTLLAHTVGAGKSLVLAATAMKLKQAGLVNKPVITIPNHLLEQFTREFQQIYPNAKLLMAGKEDFTKERRKALTAKIAASEWDAIIVTHSGFERIGMSKEFQERFLREQIAEYDALLCDRASDKGRNRNLLKMIEKQKAAREVKLHDLLAEEKKDSGLVFDELGIDHIFVDECFTYDTLIDTDLGMLKIGDIVTNRYQVGLRTLDIKSGVVEWKPVVNWFTNRRKGPLVEVVHESGSFICTPYHKLWVRGEGYNKATEVQPGAELLVLRPGLYSEACQPEVARAERAVLHAAIQDRRTDTNKAVFRVQEVILVLGVQPGRRVQKAEALLLSKLQDASATSEPALRGEVPQFHAAHLGEFTMQGPQESEGWRSDAGAAGVKRDAGQDIPRTEGDEPPAGATGRKWSPVPSPSDVGRAHRNGDRTRDSHKDDLAPDGTSAETLQSGLGLCEPQAGGGSGRKQPQLAQGAGTRCQEGHGLIPSRVVSVTFLEPGSDGEYRFGGRTHPVVYDIEVADNHNYFANGVLASNCQAFKNLEVASKMDRVAGIQTGGSERAFDLFMKCRYLHEQHPGHGVTGATGTPISNSLVELYTMQRYLDPDGLKSRGIEHFDAWAATFGEVVETMEISPDGKTLKPRARFAKFVNLPELQQMFRSFADVQTADMLNLPRPKLAGGKAEVVACPMSEDQERLQGELVARYERIRSQKVDPREDNALAITTDGRKLALDARMLSPDAVPAEDSKLVAMLDRTAKTWAETTPTRGTQMIFCDMGVNPTGWGFCVYDQIADGLAKRGIPREQIAVMGDADSDAKKQALFEKVRNGVVRVLIGSTSKMGTGTNVQKRLVAMHHLDAPWKPAEVEQRDGRILRQGNTNPEVFIYRYVTEGSFDAYMWQALETKARFINQIMTGESGLRRAEDVGGQELSYAEVKAIASGNPAVLTLAEADAELQRLAVLRKNHADEQYLARRNMKELPQQIDRTEKRLAGLTADAATLATTEGMTIKGKPASESALGNALNRLPDYVEHRRQFPVGTYHGLEFGIDRHPGGSADVYLEGKAYRTGQLSKESQGPRAVMNALNRLATSYDERIDETGKDLTLARTQLADYEARLGRPFAHGAYAEELTRLRDRLKTALSGTPAEGEPSTAELAEQIKSLKATHAVEAAPVRTWAAKVRAEPPRRRVETPAEEVKPQAEAVEELPPTTFQQRVSRGGQMSLF